MLSTNNITEEQRMHKAVVKLMSEPALLPLCGVLMVGDRKIVDDHPTAYTDGVNERYGRAYVAQMSDKCFRGLILHETGHKMYMHVTTWNHLWRIDPRRANLAADYVVDQWVQDLIDKDKVDAEVPDPTIDPRFRGMSVQQVFDLLPSGGAAGGKDEHDYLKAQSMTEAQVQELAQVIDSALRQGAMMAGKDKGGGDRVLGDLLESKVDWRVALREFITDQCKGSDFASWTRPNRRYVGSGYYMPSGVSEQVGELLIAIDTSGSIGMEELSQFLGEVKGICEQVRPQRIRLMYWDTQVCADEVYELEQLDTLAQSTKPAGGGGTDAACIPAYIAKKGYTPQAVVVLTDGYVSSWGSWAHPVLWCVVGGNRVAPPVGKAVYVD